MILGVPVIEIPCLVKMSCQVCFLVLCCWRWSLLRHREVSRRGSRVPRLFATVGFVSQFYFLLCRFPVCGDPASRASSLFQLQEICHVPYASIPHREAKHPTFLQSLSPLPLNLFSDGLPELHEHYHRPGTNSHGVPTIPFSTPHHAPPSASAS